MASWIPKISYVELYTLEPKEFTFDSPPEKDPFNEEIKGVYKETLSSSGNYQRQWSYNVQTADLAFRYQPLSVMEAFDDFMQNHALRGGEFDYYPSDDESTYYTYRMESNTYKKERPIYNGTGDFEYNFRFSIIRTLDFSLEVEGADMGYGAIGETQFTIANNQSSPTDITGLYFDPTFTRSAYISYSIYRNTTGVGATELAEAGTISAVYKSVAGSWQLSRESTGDAGIEITCTALGQFQYTSTDMTGDADVSYMKFRANTIGVEE